MKITDHLIIRLLLTIRIQDWSSIEIPLLQVFFQFFQQLFVPETIFLPCFQNNRLAFLFQPTYENKLKTLILVSFSHQFFLLLVSHLRLSQRVDKAHGLKNEQKSIWLFYSTYRGAIVRHDVGSLGGRYPMVMKSSVRIASMLGRFEGSF